MNQKIQDAFNGQLNAELFASYLYLSMAAHFEAVSLKGFAHWMRMQAEEEHGHAMRFFDNLHERGGRVVLKAIDAPKLEWSSPLEVFQDACEHEAKVTKMIDGLVDLSMAERDHAATNFLSWFVNEQVEEEATAGEIRDKLSMIGESPGAMFMMDRELGQRVAPTPPPAE